MPTKKDPTVPKAPRKRAPAIDQSAEIAALKAEILALKATPADKPIKSRTAKDPDRLIEVENKRVRPEHYVGVHPKTGEPFSASFGTAPVSKMIGGPPETVPGSPPHRVKLPAWLVESASFQTRVQKGHFEIRGSL